VMSNSMEETTKTTKKRSSKKASYEKQIYDLKQLLEISKSLCSLLDYAKLIESILYICMCQVHTLGAGAFVAKDFSSTKFELGKHYSGLDVDPKIDYSIDIEHPLIEFFNKNPKIFEQNFQKVYQDCMSKNLNLYSCLINLNFQAKSNCW